GYSSARSSLELSRPHATARHSPSAQFRGDRQRHRAHHRRPLGLLGRRHALRHRPAGGMVRRGCRHRLRLGHLRRRRRRLQARHACQHRHAGQAPAGDRKAALRRRPRSPRDGVLRLRHLARPRLHHRQLGQPDLGAAPAHVDRLCRRAARLRPHHLALRPGGAAALARHADRAARGRLNAMQYLPIFLMFLLFAANIPVAFGMAVAALSFFLFAADLPIAIFVQRLVSVTESFPLLAVPFFIMAGAIMNYAGITRRLMALADALVGHMVGGLAQANIVLATLMGGLSASANADAAMQAKMLGPEMVKRGYSPAFVAAVTASAAVITPIIPPGIGLIIYGFIADVSIGRLFIGGIIPGLLMCIALMAVTWLVSKRRGYKALRPRFVTFAELGTAFREALWALTIPIFIIVGIRGGVFTPTEAGAMTVLYATLVGFLAHKELK